MKKTLICFLAILLVMSSLTACSTNSSGDDITEEESSTETSTLNIVTTIFPIYDWVRSIAGSSASITLLEQNGTDLHSFEPTASDILAIADADIFIYIGGESDTWVDGAISAGGNENLITIALIDNVTVYEEETVEGMEAEEEEGEDADEDETEYDEHIWLSLKNAEKAVSAITEVMCEADSDNAQIYTDNADTYIESLQALDSEYTEMTESAVRDTLLFADRFPFRYLTEDYGIEYYAAFSGCSAESEASFETISFLIDKATELDLEYVLILEGSDGKIADTISGEAGTSVLTINSCQSITESDINSGVTYLSIMEDNLEILREALN